MATDIFAALSEITAGRDTTSSSQGQGSARSTDFCSQKAPVPTRFVRKQNTDFDKPRNAMAKSLKQNAQSETSEFYVAHRRYVAELLVSPKSSLDQFLELDIWDQHLEALQTL